MADHDDGYDPGRASHTALLAVRKTAIQHPAITAARGEPGGQFIRIEARIDRERLDGASKQGTLSIRWFAGTTPESRPSFSFHYADGSGFDCGFHHEPNPHVDGWGHYQERAGEDDSYTYEAVTYEVLQPVRVFWEVLDRLEWRLSTRS